MNQQNNNLSNHQLNGEQRQILIDIAGASIDFGLANGQPLSVKLPDYAAQLQERRATFVTLQISGKLRGCIGSLEPQRPLVADVAYNSYAAAFLDHRFLPLTAAERRALDLHISILSLPTLMVINSEAELLAQIRPCIDGLILEDRGRRGTFLPSVWENLNHPSDFVTQLKIKAGFPANYWSPTIKVFRYTTESFSQS